MNKFFEGICVGGNQTGISAFVSTYLSDLLTYGSAAGEMIADDSGFYALYNGELSALEVKRAQNNLDIEFYNSGKNCLVRILSCFPLLIRSPAVFWAQAF